MEANTGIYDFVYIEQDIIYSYLSRNFLVDITKTLKDNPKLEGAGLRRRRLHHLHQLLQGRQERRPLRRADGGLRQGLSLPQGPLRRSEDRRKPSRPSTAATSPRPRRTRNIATSPSSSPSGARTTAWSCGAPPSRRIPAIPSSWYEFFESWRADLRRLQLGHQRRQELRRVGRQWRLDERPGGQGGARLLARATSNIAPPESTQSTWDEVAATFAAGRAAQGLVYGENAAWIATNADKSQGRRQCRRRAAAARRPA